MRYPNYLLKLIESFKRLPGVGTRSAERFAFNLLDWSDEELSEFIKNIEDFKKSLNICSLCGCLVDRGVCFYCDSSKRDTDILCITATAKDVFAIESTHEYHGLYHVLGGLLSPMEGYDTDSLSINKLKERIEDLKIREVIIALDSTLEGDATALHLRRELVPYDVKVSRLAFGLPMGSSFEYVDQGTLAQAMHGRQQF